MDIPADHSPARNRGVPIKELKGLDGRPVKDGGAMGQAALNTAASSI